MSSSTKFKGNDWEEWCDKAVEGSNGESSVVKEHKDLLEEMHKIYKQKNEAYGNSFDTTLDKVGNIAGYVRLSDKFNRFETLTLNPDIDTGDESYLDTLIDMANYAIMIYMWEVRNKNK